MFKKLNRSLQLWELIVNLFNIVLLCFVFEDLEGKFFLNRIKLYDEFVLCVLRRYCVKKEDFLYNNDFIEVFVEQFSLLGKMVFEVLLNDQVYFILDELKC